MRSDSSLQRTATEVTALASTACVSPRPVSIEADTRINIRRNRALHLILVAAIYNFLSLPLSARVGEPYADFQKRVGNAWDKKEIFKGCFRYMHQKGDLFVTVYVLDGKCAEEIYQKLTLPEVKKLLDQQFGDVWKEVPAKTKGVLRWEARGLTAIYGINEGSLSISSPELTLARMKALDHADRVRGL